MSHLHFYSTELPDNEANGFALSVQFWTTEISTLYKKTALPFSISTVFHWSPPRYLGESCLINMFPCQIIHTPPTHKHTQRDINCKNEGRKWSKKRISWETKLYYLQFQVLTLQINSVFWKYTIYSISVI